MSDLSQSQSSDSQEWHLFRNTGIPNSDWQMPDAPGWRPFGRSVQPGVDRRKQRAKTFQMQPEQIDMVNAAIYLRRPLLITGKPGTGKSSLAYKVAKELVLGEVLYWPITTRTTQKSGLYRYDAIGRLQETEQRAKSDQGFQPPESIGKYITLGPLGTALLPLPKPRVLLIDEIDKGDIDLPNDLLSVFEEGWFEIPELERIKSEVPAVEVRTAYADTEEPTASDIRYQVREGRVSCEAFPLVILTSNGERDFPPAFLRRCLRLRMAQPNEEMLGRIVSAHLDAESEALSQTKGEAVANERRAVAEAVRNELIKTFIEKRKENELSTDQLLNALFMVTRERAPVGSRKERLINALLKPLSSAEDLAEELAEDLAETQDSAT